MESLVSLGEKHDTDKVVHCYLPHYEARFQPFRNQPITLLEIGIMQGASLRMWRDFFPEGLIYGIDIDPKLIFTEPRIRTFAGAQANGPFLDSVLAETGPLDIVVDDGSHRAADHLASFHHLWPHVKPGGWYCIEDCFSMFYSMWATLDGQVRPGVTDPVIYDDPTILDFLYGKRDLIVTGGTDFAEIHLVTGGIYDGILAMKKK